MKRLLCLFTAIIIIMSLAACSTNDAESSSEGQEISKTEISRQDEQPSEGESSFAEVSEPVSEEASEQPPEVSEPQQSIDDDYSPYRVVSAHSAEELLSKLKEIYASLNDGGAFDGNVKEADYYAPIGGILAKGFIFNPSVDGIYAENDPNSVYGKIEMIFDSDGMVTIIYYCRNDNDVWARVQINYPEEKAGQLIAKYGADGFRMYCSGSEKPLSSLTTQEIAAMEHDSVSIQNILFEGKTFEALKYVNESRGHTNTVTFLYEDVIVTINYKYRDSDANIDDILDTIKLEKLYFDESSEDVSRDEPQPSIDPEDFPYRVVSAHSAAELVAKLKDISDKINGNKASDFNMKDIDYLEPIDDILSLGYIFNPSVDGIYAENDSEEPHGKIEMVFRADHTVTAIYYCRNDDDIWASIQIVYPNADIIRLTGEYGAEGLGMYNAKSNKRITEMTEQQQTNAGFRNATIENITLEGQIYDSMKYARSSGGNTTTIVYEGIPVVISYKYNSEELKATHNADEILDTIKLEKLYFDGQPRDDSPTIPDCTYGQAENYPIFGAYDASGIVDNLIEINEQLKNGTAPLYDPSYYVCMKQILSDEYVLNPTFNGEYAKNAFDYPPVEIDFIPILTVISYDFSTKECIFRINAMYPEGKNATNISKYGIEGFAMSIFDCPDTPLDKMPEDKINYVCASAEIKTINVGGNDYTALICTNMWGMRDTAAFLYEGKIIEIEFEPRNGCRETLESLLGKVGLEKYGFASDR